jgi:hypothetical protein
MDEAEWLASEDPAAMLAYLVGPDASQMHLPAGRRAGRLGRKLRLWVEACQFHINPVAHWGEVDDVIVHDWGRPNGWPAKCPLAWRAAVLRCVVGNPFRPFALCGSRRRPFHNQWAHVDANDGFWLEAECPACRPLLTPAVLGIARRAYDERDFAALPVLADALEEAGCREESVLRHLRGWEQCPECLDPLDGARLYCTRCGGSGWILGPFTCSHVRGCWVTDLVLGKE